VSRVQYCSGPLEEQALEERVIPDVEERAREGERGERGVSGVEQDEGEGLAWLLLAFGLWNGLQFAALAFGRAQAIASSRYLDTAAFNVILNCICLAILCGRRRIIQLVWIGIIGVGLYAQSSRAWTEAQHRFDTALRQESNVRSFLASGYFLPGASGADLSLPYPDTARLSRLLSDPRVKRLLPSNLQAAIPHRDAGDVPRRERLGFLRDVLLRVGPYLAGVGLLVLLSLIMDSILRAGRARWAGVRPA